MALILSSGGAQYDEVNNITLTYSGSGYPTTMTATLSKSYRAVALTMINARTVNSGSGSPQQTTFTCSVSGNTLSVTCGDTGVGFNPANTHTVSIIGIL